MPENKTDLNTVIHGVSLTKTVNVSSDADRNDTKSVTLRINYDGCTIGDVLNKCTSAVVIQWQTAARKRFTKLPTVVDIVFKPGRATIDPVSAFERYLASMTPEDRKKELDRLSETIVVEVDEDDEVEDKDEG